MSAHLTLAFVCYGAVVAAVFRIRGLPLLVRRILRLYAAYGVLAFGARGLYLALTQPRPKLNDPMPITKLYTFGYTTGLPRILELQTLSLAVIAIVVSLLCRWRVAESDSGEEKTTFLRRALSPELAFGLLVVYAIGWMFRIYNLHGSSDYASVTTTVTSAPVARLAAISLVVPALVLFGTEWWRRGSHERLLVALLIPCEIGWAIVADTKAPIVAVLAAAYLGGPVVVRVGRERVRHFVTATAMIISVLAVFSVLNGARELAPKGLSRGDALWQASSGLVAHPTDFAALSVRRLLVRLDGLNAATDAYLPPTPHYMDGWEATDRAARLMVPSIVTGNSKQLPGLLWAQRVSGSKYRVSLAEGVGPEGFSIGGLLGLVVFSGLLGATIVGAGMLVTRSEPFSLLRVCATALIASAALYERGMLGVVELAGNSLQGGLIAWIVLEFASMRVRPIEFVDLSSVRHGSDAAARQDGAPRTESQA